DVSSVSSKVAVSLQAAMRDRSQRTELTQDWVLQRLQAEAQLRGEGSSHSARVRALELLGKHLALFPDRHEHRHGGDPANATPVQHDHAFIPANALDLPLEEKVKLLDQIEAAHERARQQAQPAGRPEPPRQQPNGEPQQLPPRTATAATPPPTAPALPCGLR